MAAHTPRSVVVEIDDLYFKISKLRGRRSLRVAKVIHELLGARGIQMLTTPEFWGLTGPAAELAKKDPATFEKSQLRALADVASETNANLDAWESGMGEALKSTDRGQQGVQYSETERDIDEAGWVPIRHTGSLDAYDFVDYMTWLALGWETIKLGYRPTTAAAGTSADTRSAATTSTPASGQAGDAPKPRPGGAPSPSLTSGISGG